MNIPRNWMMVSLLFGSHTAQVCRLSGQIVTTSSLSPGSVSQTATVVLTDRGIRPGHLYVKAGATALLIQNRSRIRTLTAEITQSGQTTSAITSQHTPTQIDNTFFFTVQPGTYNFTVVQQPSWNCVLVVSTK